MAIPAAVLGLVQAAPMLLRWLGGDKAGDAAEKAIEVARTVAGVEDPEEAVRLIRADPQLALRYREAIAQIEAEMDRAYLADRADARGRDVSVVQLKGGNWRADVLALGALVGLIALTYTLLFVPIPDGPARDVLLLLSGALVAIVKDVFAFEFGSSRGSKEKDGQIAKLVERQP